MPSSVLSKWTAGAPAVSLIFIFSFIFHVIKHEHSDENCQRPLNKLKYRRGKIGRNPFERKEFFLSLTNKLQDNKIIVGAKTMTNE